MILDKKFLCADLGSKYTGLAYFQKNSTPFPLMLPRIESKTEQQTLEILKTHIEDDFYTDLVVGVPYFLDGQATTTTQKMLAFIEKAKDYLGIPVHAQDETLSTFEAKERMKVSPAFNFKIDLTKIDSLSAVVILEDFLATFDLE
jgi:putative Holliday junction resolvase